MATTKQRIAAHFNVLSDIYTSSFSVKSSLKNSRTPQIRFSILPHSKKRFDLDQ
jgi:hypothetical protein